MLSEKLKRWSSGYSVSMLSEKLKRCINVARVALAVSTENRCCRRSLRDGEMTVLDRGSSMENVQIVFCAF